MPQRLDFPLLPRAGDHDYWPKLNALLRFVDEVRPNRRELREQMQDLEIWDRHLFEGFFDLIQIDKHGKRWRLGGLARRLVDAAGDEEEQGRLVFRYFLRENPILARYVFDALEERLYSDAELWRYLTSYVYPGDKVGGQQFRDWLRWGCLCGVLRTLGVRYAFAPGIADVKQAVSRIDVEELLEEWEEEGDEDDDEDEEDEEPPPPPPPPPAEPEPEDEPEEEDLPDPPGFEPGPVAAEGPLPAAPAAPVPPPAAEPVDRRPLPFSPPELEPAEAVAENLARVRAWWRQVPERPLTRAEDLGLMALAWEAGDRRVFVLQVAALATIVAGDPRPADRPGFVNLLNRGRFFPELMEDPAALLAFCEGQEWFCGDPGHAALAENLIHVLRYRAALAADPELPDALAAADGPGVLIGLLRERLLGAGALLEPHWIVRELVRAGVWTAEGLSEAAVVPSRQTRLAAWRLGLLDVPQADGPDDLLAAARAIAGHLGPEDDFGEPLESFCLHHGCSSPCRFAAGCPFHCREEAAF